jgi:PAS domain S-box-containing protein
MPNCQYLSSAQGAFLEKPLKANRILIINDTPDQLHLMETVLGCAGYSVLTASNGCDALQIARRECPDLIISDVAMPRLDGIELCRQIRAENQFQMTPILLVSAVCRDSESAVAGLAAGADDYIESPYDPVRLVAQVAQLLQRKSYEESLRASRDQYRSLLEQAADGIFIIDLNGNYLDGNLKGLEMLGYTREELLQMNASDIVPAEDLATAPLRYDELRAGKTVMSERRLRRKDGTLVYVEINAKMLADGRLQSIVRDITERKQAEELLRKSQAQLFAFLDALPLGVFVIDAEGKPFYANRDATQLLGKGIVPKARLDKMAEVYQAFLAGTEQLYPAERMPIVRALSGEKTSVEDMEIHHPDRIIPLHVSAVPIYGEDGKISFAIAAFNDITNRKQAAEALRKSEQRYRNLFENANDIIYTTDLTGNFTSINQAGERILGYTVEEGLKLNFAETIAPEHLETAHRMLTRKLNGEKTPAYEIEVLSKDGRRVPLEVSTRLIYKGDTPIGVQGIARDITERKQMEQALHEADRRAIGEYEQLLEKLASLAQSLGTARDLLIVYRALRDFALASTPCSGIFVSLYDQKGNVRRAAYAWSEGEEVDVSNLPLMPMGNNPHSRAVATGQIIITDDFQATIGDAPCVNVGLESDPRLPQSSLVAPMAVMGRIIGAVEVQSVELAAFTQEHATAMRMAANLAANAIENVKLIEREREREEMLRQSQKIEAVGKLAGGIAHDFNNILTAINGYSDLALRRVKEDDRLRNLIEEVKKAGERAAGLTRQLLAFSRKQVLQPKVLSLNDVVTYTNKMLRRLIGEDIDLILHLDSRLGNVKADPGQMEQVLLNLAVNARDAMPHGGKLIIQTENVMMEEEIARKYESVQSGPHVRLVFTDTGCGMDAETQKRIFEPFFTTKEVGKGTGLGLSMVYGIVKQSGGYISVYSEIGKGTTFKIYLPRVYENVSEPVETSEKKITPGTETVLIVEDEELVRRMSRSILEGAGYTVLEAASGGAALEICKQYQSQIDLMVTDVVMPQMSGRELAEQAKLLRPRMNVLYMSGYTDDAIVHHGVLEEGTPFLEKPFSPNALAHKVREVLDVSK